jgi:hypothetical protein
MSSFCCLLFSLSALFWGSKTEHGLFDSRGPPEHAGLVILYDSIVKKKWAVNSAFMTLYAFAAVLICWVLVGYRMAFGDELLPFWGKGNCAAYLGNVNRGRRCCLQRLVVVGRLPLSKSHGNRLLSLASSIFSENCIWHSTSDALLVQNRIPSI